MTSILDKSTQVVQVTLGEISYSWPVVITENEGKDISDSQIQVSVTSDRHAPGPWRDPDVDVSGPVNVRRVQVLVDDTYAAGSYWIWVRVTDTPEIVIDRPAQFYVA